MNLNDANSFLAANSNRRSFLRKSLGLGAGAAVLPAAMTLAPRSAKAEDAAALAQDLQVLTLALNLEYLEAEFYTYAQYGEGIEAHAVGVTGKTDPGQTIVKTTGSTQVPFADATTAQYAAEIAQDERNHVNFLRSVFVAAGVTPPSKPTIDLFNSFNTAAMVGGIGSSFDPFASDVNFLLGSFIFEDVGVTAYHGGAPLLTNPAYLSSAAGILAVEAIHAATVRTLIYLAGADAIKIASQISNLRDSLDGGSDKDQDLTDPEGRADFPVNIVPANIKTATVFARNERKVLNIVYGGKGLSGGLFFPDGINM